VPVHSMRLLLVQLLRLVLCGVARGLLSLFGLVFQAGGPQDIRCGVLSLLGFRWMGIELFLLWNSLVRVGACSRVE
jgi:hypothetical protein